MASLLYRDVSFPLLEKIVIGRLKTCDLSLADQGASREHSKVFVDAKGRVWLEDLGSSNGTKLNGVVIKLATQLSDGDVITCAKSDVSVSIDAADRTHTDGDQAAFCSESLVGESIGGHRVLSIIGSTNIVTVYRARQLSLDREVVIKVVNPSFADSDSPLADHISQQTKLAARINHANITQVHECGVAHNFIWSSMELIEGETLAALLERETQLVPDVALMITDKIADGLAAAHEQDIIHRALNPRNIMISTDGRVKVVDAVLEQFLRVHFEQKGIPTPPDYADYLAPELFQHKKGAANCDVYSLGCILFHMLAGRPPYVCGSASQTAQAHLNDAVPQLSEYCPDLPESLSELLSSMLHKNPEWRHESMEEVREKIRSIRSALPKEVSTVKTRRSHTERDVVDYEMLTAADKSAAAPASSARNFIITVILLAVIGGGVYLSQNKLQDTPQQDMPPVPVGHTTKPPVPPVPSPDPQPISNNTTGDTKSIVDDSPRARMWAEAESSINAHIAAAEWDNAEYELRRVLPKIKAHRALRAAAQNMLNQILLDGRVWYQAELTHVRAYTSTMSVQDMRARFIELGTIRTKVLQESRADIESRYQQAYTHMHRQLLSAQREAGQLLQAGKITEMALLPPRSASAFKGTNLARAHRDFTFLVTEASNISYHQDWDTTRQELVKSTGEKEMIAASAALILCGNPDSATDMLLQHPLFTNARLHKRRDAILRTQSQLLSFNHVADLNDFKLGLIEPGLDNGFLTGNSEELYDLSYAHALADTQWEISMKMFFPNGLSDNAEVLLQVGTHTAQPISISLTPRNITVRIESANEHIEVPMSYSSHKTCVIRMTYYQGRISIFGNNALITEAQIDCPTDSRLSFIFSQANWQLHGLRVLGAVR